MSNASTAQDLLGSASQTLGRIHTRSAKVATFVSSANSHLNSAHRLLDQEAFMLARSEVVNARVDIIDALTVAREWDQCHNLVHTYETLVRALDAVDAGVLDAYVVA